ncbi:chromosome segregation protein [Bacillus sp. UMB0899]|uniref:MerR family transcriptional regulator n=1 Tax=Metabacillus schmidteae TaxID=2730405 RepID=UPI000C80B6EF|nr:MerR family transcriptional regulator [Metabacillus schmidteae]PMC37445.1 chromosome segregation protein [Bacillus sp. UMB0899]
MSTAAVAKSLGVSRRTLMRWVEQLNLELSKNELGHYQFSDADIEKLKQIQENTDSVLPQQKEQQSRKAIVMTKTVDEDKMVELTNRIEQVEQSLQRKADDVVSYQLLQHRKEMEELTRTISKLEKRIEELEQTEKKPELAYNPALVFDQGQTSKKPRRKGLISSILGF